MLKFDRIGWGSKVNPNGYVALLNEADVKEAVLHLVDEVASSGVGDSGTPAVEFKGNCGLRHVGTGCSLEGHFAVSVDDDTVVKVSDCSLTVKASITRVVPAGASKLDLSGLFLSGDGKLAVTDLLVDGAAATSKATVNELEDGDPADLCVVTLTTPAPVGGTKVTVNFDLCVGNATTNNNAEEVNLDKGNYQVHLVANAYSDVTCTNMPNPTMLEFVKHCRPLNVVC